MTLDEILDEILDANARWVAAYEAKHGHWHDWYASFIHLGFLGSHCARCGERRFLGGYDDPRKDAIVERLNRSWRVREAFR